jgi:hypothetical protein
MESGITGTGATDPRFAPSGDGHDAGEEMKERATELTRRARGRAMQTIDQRKGEVSGLLDRMADTMQDDHLGAYVADIARRGAQLLRGRSADELLSSARSEVTARPAAFLSLSFLAGFAIARLARR